MTFYEMWRRLGVGLDVSWLLKYPSGGKAPPEEPTKKSFLAALDDGVAHVHDKGLGILWSILLWHYGMAVMFFLVFGGILAMNPWKSVVQKLVIFFNVWESLGLGVGHGPMHGKMAPPFQDWWYRMTPGTMKYNAPFMPFLKGKRSYLDILVEGFLTYVFSFRALLAPEVTPELMIPIACCAIYEFIFDHGQFMHTYGTQNLHLFVCGCFQNGQKAGMQLMFALLYFGSGFCKLGPTFPLMFGGNLMTAKFMVDVPWAAAYRRLMYKDLSKKDYRLTNVAWYVANFAAIVELAAPLLTWTNRPFLVTFAISTIAQMHLFIIATLPGDVFAWNLVCAVLFGLLHHPTGFDWADLYAMHPLLALWLLLHLTHVVYGHLVPDHVPYVVAHRHAAGNWSQGVLVFKKSALPKLERLTTHVGFQCDAPTSWYTEWLGFTGFFCYCWNWNVPSRLLVPILLDILKGGDFPANRGTFTGSDVVLAHSVPFFDGVVAHVRFDGLSSVQLVQELGRVCGFEKGECRLAWVGAFPSFFVPTPRASWRIVDAASGVLKHGTFSADDVLHPAWKTPSDLSKTHLPAMIANAITATPENHHRN